MKLFWRNCADNTAGKAAALLSMLCVLREGHLHRQPSLLTCNIIQSICLICLVIIFLEDRYLNFFIDVVIVVAVTFELFRSGIHHDNDNGFSGSLKSLIYLTLHFLPKIEFT